MLRQWLAFYVKLQRNARYLNQENPCVFSLEDASFIVHAQTISTNYAQYFAKEAGVNILQIAGALAPEEFLESSRFGKSL